MQRVAGVSWAKSDSDNALFGKDDSSAVLQRGSLRSLSDQIASLFQEMHAVVTCIRASEPVRLENRQQKKVARCNWRSNLPRCLALIHDRGMKQHKAEGQKAKH